MMSGAWIGLMSMMLVSKPSEQVDMGPPVLTGSAEAGIYAGRQPDQDAVVVSPRVELGVRARPEVELGISVGVASMTARHDRDGRVRAQGPGNFVFGTRWVRDDPTERHHGHLGFLFAFPTTLDPSDALRSAHRLARASRGGLNPWEWSPATMGVLVPAGWSTRVRRFDLGVDGAFGGMFSAAGDQLDPGFLGQVRAGAGVRVWRAHVGGALAAVYNGREDTGAFQASVQPFVSLALCRDARAAACGLHLDARASVNLDAPYGFAPGGERIWGTQLGLRWAIRDALDEPRR